MRSTGQRISWTRLAGVIPRTRPDAFRPDLATSLNNQSNRLAELDRREDALAASTEAVDIYREAGRGPPGRVSPRPRRVADIAGDNADRAG